MAQEERRVAKGKNGRQSVEPPSKGRSRSVTPSTQRAKSQQQQKKTSPKKQPPRAKQETSESETHIWIGIVLIFIGIFFTISIGGYLKYWEVDSDVASSMALGKDASNWGGHLGAIIGEALVGGWIGIAALAIPLSLLVAGVRLIARPRSRWFRSLTATMLVAFALCVALGHFCGRDAAVFGSGWGGASGIRMADWLHSTIGYEGTGLLIIFVMLCALYYRFGRVIRKYVRRAAKSAEVRKKRLAAERERQRLLLIEQEERNRAIAAQIAQRRAEAAKTEISLPKAEPEVEPEPEPQKPLTIVPPAKEEPQELPDDTIFEVREEAREEVTQEEEPLPSPLIELEGNQWGFVTSYSSEGEPQYLYFDRAATTSPAQPEVEEEQFSVREESPVVEQEVTEEEEIDFTVVDTTLPENVEEQKSALDFEVEKAKEEEKLDGTDINTIKLYDPTAELSHYQKPMVELLQNHTERVVVTKEELKTNKDRIVHTLETFGIRIDSIKATVGPTVTLYEIIPAPGVRISKIKNLEDDIALTLSALGIRIIAPIPGKGTIGIEVPNSDKETVSMSSVIRAAKFQDFKGELPIALGKTIQNETFVFDLAKMPHLLVAGATGQGKSVGLNAIITSLLYKKHPSELKFVLVDPKKVELTLYNKLEKHFLAKMEGEDDAIITDTQKVVYTLNSLCVEMDARYDLLKLAEVRNIVEYNHKFTHRRLLPTKGHRYLPYFVVIIDEFADLIMTAGREIEAPIARIAQLARAVGIHLIIATQRPTTNIITGVIKANFPARIAFRVTSMIDSRTILDTPGANQLIGRGDMLVSTGSEVTRVQCAFIDTPEVDDITKFISSQRGYVSAYELPEYVPESEQSGAKDVDLTRKDPLFNDVARHVVATQTGSASTIQRKFSIGFNRAGRIVDQLEASGIVGAQSGSKPREVLIQDPATLEIIIGD